MDMRRSINGHTLNPTPARDMLAAGIDIIPDRKNNLGAKREKQGKCPTCGTQTHKVTMFGKKNPLTIEGEVFKGRCLKCRPLEGYIRRSVPHDGAHIGSSRLKLAGRQQHQHHSTYHQSYPPHQMNYFEHEQQQLRHQYRPQTQNSRHQPQHLQTRHYQTKVEGNLLRQPKLEGNFLRQARNQQFQRLSNQQLFHPTTESGISVPHTLEVGIMADDDVSVLTQEIRWGQTGPMYQGEEEEAEAPPINRRPGPDRTDDIAKDITAATPGQKDHSQGRASGTNLTQPSHSDLQKTGASGPQVGFGSEPQSHFQAEPATDSYRRSVASRPSLPVAQKHPDSNSMYRSSRRYSQQVHSMETNPSKLFDQHGHCRGSANPIAGSISFKSNLQQSDRNFSSSSQIQEYPHLQEVPQHELDPGGYERQSRLRDALSRDSQRSFAVDHGHPTATAHETGKNDGYGGYPTTGKSNAWEPQKTSLPAIGMDPLLKNRSGEENYRRSHVSLQDEIKFQPSPPLPNADQGQSPVRMQTKPRVLNRSDSYSPDNPRKIMSMESGPVYNIDGDEASHLEKPQFLSQSSRPAYQYSETNAGGPQENSQRAFIPKDESHLVGTEIERTNPLMRKAVELNHVPKDVPPNLRHSRKSPQRQSSDMGSQSQASTFASTLAPPLVSRDLRGRPDDDIIQDPLTANQHVLPPIPGVSLPKKIGLLDDEEEQTENPPVTGSMSLSFGAAGTQPDIPEEAPCGSDELAESKSTKKLEEEAMKTSIGKKSPGITCDGIAKVQAKNTSDQPTLVGAEVARPSSSVRQESTMFHSRAAAVTKSGGTGNEGAILEDELEADFQQRSVSREDYRQSNQELSRQPTICDVPLLLQRLNSSDTTPDIREDTLRDIAMTLWYYGEDGKETVLKHRGVEVLTKSMWDDIGNARVQDAAVEFLLALAASWNGEHTSDALSNIDSVCDSLLFSMQTHAHVESIQLKGCSVFSCLATASANNREISDGSLSGASRIVLNAMNHHANSPAVLKAGLQALYCQCILSSNAESNKRTLVESQLEDGASAINLILDTMCALTDDSVAMEWACRLLWSLTSNEDLLKSISSIPGLMQQVVSTCQRETANPAAATTLEACLGVIGNLAHLESNRIALQRSDVIAIIVEGMICHAADYAVNIEACSAIANFSVSMSQRVAVIKAGGLGAIFRAMQTFMDSAEFVAEAVRAMVCLSIQSLGNKESLATPDTIKFLVRVSSKHKDESCLQAMCCSLLASLAVRRATCEVIVDNGGIDLIRFVLKSNSEARVQSAACFAYCNLTCQIQNVHSLMNKGMANTIVKAMSSNENNFSIQTNACCAIWNLAFKTEQEPGIVVGSDGILAIVKAMQNHMESCELLEVACGAIWSLVDNSIDRKKDVVGSGGIDAVVCTLFMHPTSTSTLFKACGVFSNVSSESPLAEAIAGAQGISVVVDAMRNNGAAIAFLEIGCLTLRNIVCQFPEYAQDASMVISTIIDAMRESVDVLSFQEEACNLLWVLAAEAESCQSKILAMDGIAVLMKCLEHNSYDQGVQVAALGAFNQLAANGGESYN